MTDFLASPPKATGIHLDAIEIRYGATPAVRGVSLQVAPGEVLALVGPSGCGKTSLLKAIAGLEPLAGGAVHFDDQRIDTLPSHQRQVGMVFQNYALFPHMTVQQNVAFGLRLQADRVDAQTRTARVARALELLHIGHLAGSWPDQLSGGQQQRVALARTLVLEPRVLLLDEPLSALDRQLRDTMRSEIRQLAKSVGITTVLVTHDQDEALAMADRIAVMRAGELEQAGTPRELFNRPRTAFVARFMGRANVLSARCAGPHQADCALATLAGKTVAVAWPESKHPPVEGAALQILVRPDGLGLCAPSEADALPATLTEQLFMGEKTELRLRLADGQWLRAEMSPDATLPAVGSSVGVRLHAARSFGFGAEEPDQPRP